jgi:hypothetical protein
MDNSQSILAALAGFDGEQESYVGDGERMPTLRWRSGSTEVRNMIKMMGGGNIPDDMFLALNGYWFISEDDIPADEDGAQIEMQGFVPLTYTNTNGKEVTGLAAPSITFSIIGIRKAHFNEEGRNWLTWGEGWEMLDGERKGYKLGYTRRRMQVRILLDGHYDHEFVIDVQGGKQFDFQGNPNNPGIIYRMEKEILPSIAKALGTRIALPLMAAQVTVGPKMNDETGEVIFTASSYMEDGQEKTGVATTTFSIQDSQPSAAEAIGLIIEYHKDAQDWLNEWKESKPASGGSSQSKANEEVQADGL